MDWLRVYGHEDGRLRMLNAFIWRFFCLAITGTWGWAVETHRPWGQVQAGARFGQRRQLGKFGFCHGSQRGHSERGLHHRPRLRHLHQERFSHMWQL